MTRKTMKLCIYIITDKGLERALKLKSTKNLK